MFFCRYRLELITKRLQLRLSFFCRYHDVGVDPRTTGLVMWATKSDTGRNEACNRMINHVARCGWHHTCPRWCVRQVVVEDANPVHTVVVETISAAGVVGKGRPVGWSWCLSEQWTRQPLKSSPAYIHFPRARACPSVSCLHYLQLNPTSLFAKRQKNIILFLSIFLVSFRTLFFPAERLPKGTLLLIVGSINHQKTSLQCNITQVELHKTTCAGWLNNIDPTHASFKVSSEHVWVLLVVGK